MRLALAEVVYAAAVAVVRLVRRQVPVEPDREPAGPQGPKQPELAEIAYVAGVAVLHEAACHVWSRGVKCILLVCHPERRPDCSA